MSADKVAPETSIRVRKTHSNDARLRKMRPKSKIETEEEINKRKSEVLIAAQSLDNEIKNVKNLKRLSIGSLDLLIDPELEFRVNSNANPPDINSIKRKSWASDKSDTSYFSKDDYTSSFVDSTTDIYDETTDTDTDNITNSSIDITRAEYLHDGSLFISDSSRSDSIGTDRLIRPSSFSNSNSSSHSTSSSQLTRRNLSGIGSLRRGAHNVEYNQIKRNLSTESKKSQNDNKDNNDNEDDAIASNLLWVPASQHPSVKPENYIELVQDTLQNIQIKDEQTSEQVNKVSNSNEEEQNKENTVVDNNRLSTKRKYNRMVVRRPSSLRKSYTELTDSDSDTNENDETGSRNQGRMPIKLRESKTRTTSLKDITEELTKISNNAGLTDSDAITLARTLSMAGSFSSMEDKVSNVEDRSNTHRKSSNDVEEAILDHDEELASKMFMMNGVTIPQRSSLRRSKFNTYRIRSSASSADSYNRRHSGETIDSNSSSDHRDKEQPVLPTLRSPAPFDTNSQGTIPSAESPGSISDLYDHYTQSDKKYEVEEDFDHVTTDMSIPTSQESSLLSSDSVLYHPNNNDLTGNGSLLQESTESPIIIETMDDNGFSDKDNSDVRKESWSWSNNSENHHYNDNNIDNGDLIDNAHSEGNINLKSRSNHSKNRHKPIINISKTSSNLTPNKVKKGPINTEVINQYSTSDRSTSSHTNFSQKSTVPTSRTDTTNVASIDNSASHSSNNDETINASQKKSTLEEKLVKLFKRKAHRRSSTPTTITTGKSNDSGVQEELKKKISKFRKNPKKQLNLGKSVREIDVNENNTLLTTISNEQQVIKEMERDAPDISDLFKIEKGDELSTLQPAVSVTSTKNKEIPTAERTLVTESNDINRTAFTETVCELDGDDSQDISNTSETIMDTSVQHENIEVNEDSDDLSSSIQDQTNNIQIVAGAAPLISSLPPRELTFSDVKRPEKPNASIQFTDSAFGFPLPALTNSTVIMFHHRLGINVERAIYRLSHLKLSDSKRELRQQVLLSNFMYAYLNLVNHTLYLEQAAANDTVDYDTYNSDEQEMEENDYVNQYSENNGQEMSTDRDVMEDDSETVNNMGNAYNAQFNSNNNLEYATEHNNSNGAILIPDI